MILPTRGKYLCEILSRTRQLESGLWLAEKLKEEKKDNVVRCLGVGDPAIKSCYLCQDKRTCKGKCKGKGRIVPMVARRTDILHYKQGFGQKIRYECRQYIFLRPEDLIAIERNSILYAMGSMVIVKLIREDEGGRIVFSDGAKILEGKFYGEVISIGPDFTDKTLKVGDKLIFLRNEGYRFRAYEGDSREEYLAVKGQWCYGKDKI